jgi:hypothetical protein
VYERWKVTVYVVVNCSCAYSCYGAQLAVTFFFYGGVLCVFVFAVFVFSRPRAVLCVAKKKNHHDKTKTQTAIDTR